MLAYEWAAKSPTVGDLNVDMRSLYLLAAPSTPVEARTEVIDRAEAGEHFTHAQVKGSRHHGGDEASQSSRDNFCTQMTVP
jgi:hypothetical protein